MTTRRWATATRGLGALVRGALAGGKAGATPGVASDAGVPGPVEAHADSNSTAANRYESSARPQQIVENMALLIEGVPAVWRVPEGHSSVRKLCAARNRTPRIGHQTRELTQVVTGWASASLPGSSASGGTPGFRYNAGTVFRREKSLPASRVQLSHDPGHRLMSHSLEQKHGATANRERLPLNHGLLRKPAGVVTRNTLVHHQRCQVGSQWRGMKAVRAIE